MVHQQIEKAIQDQALDDAFAETVTRWYEPLANEVALKAALTKGCFILGVQGCQGSGKSTLASFLKILLETHHSFNVAVLSIDDLYHTRATRRRLAADIHPLLATRGVPGTHDLELANRVINDVQLLKQGERVTLPRFDKAIDDRANSDQWPQLNGPVDVLIFEGWCVGASPQTDNALEEAINSLEKEEDADKRWRQFVNAQLAGDYKTLFSLIDAQIVLSPPSFDCVYAWRLKQEKKLAQKIQDENRTASNLLSPEELKRFISHYERLTRHCIESLPQKADWLFTINEQQQITNCIRKQ